MATLAAVPLPGTKMSTTCSRRGLAGTERPNGWKPVSARPPLDEERPYWEKYFELLSVKDAHARKNCRHENGAEPWACCNCDCTKRLEDRLKQWGGSFLATLQKQAAK